MLNKNNSHNNSVKTVAPVFSTIGTTNTTTATTGGSDVLESNGAKTDNEIITENAILTQIEKDMNDLQKTMKQSQDNIMDNMDTQKSDYALQALNGITELLDYPKLDYPKSDSKQQSNSISYNILETQSKAKYSSTMDSSLCDTNNPLPVTKSSILDEMNELKESMDLMESRIHKDGSDTQEIIEVCSLCFYYTVC